MQNQEMKDSAAVSIDGRMGEGGGQVLRSSLTLSLCSGRPVRIENIRAGRRKPGLMRQHLACVRAAVAISNGSADGDALSSGKLTFTPGLVQSGDFQFAVGSAGSALLVLQTVLVPLMLADGPSTVRIEGGTHNAWAPPIDFLQQSFLPQLEKMGAKVNLRMERIGFFPAGGGVIFAEIQPLTRADAKPLTLMERGAAGHHYAILRRAHLAPNICDREWDAMRRVLLWDSNQRRDFAHDESAGPGNAVHAFLQFENVTEVVTSFGTRQRGAKDVGRDAGKQANSYLYHTAPVGQHLADQLLVPMALLRGGEFVTVEPSKHTVTNVEVLNAFLPDMAQITELDDGRFTVQIRDKLQD
jgi:RNA 3'-terminal phosphate cyclase (ATP)